jgi:hypothetical protein
MARRTAGTELTGAQQGFKHAYRINILKSKIIQEVSKTEVPFRLP